MTFAAGLALPNFGAATPSVTGSGGGGPGFAGNLSWGPDFGESGGSDGKTFGVSAALTMPTLGLSHTRTIGVNLTMPSLALASAFSVSVGLTGTALGAPFWQSIGTVDSTTTGTSVVIPKPSGLAVGELMVSFIGSSGLTTMTLPSGWTQIRNTQRTGVLNCTLNSAWKIADSSDVAASNFTFTLSASGAFFGSIHRMNGIDSTTPINVSAEGSGSATNPVAPSATTTVANTLVFVACVQSSTLDLTYTPPSGFTERSDQNGLGALGAHTNDGETATKVFAASGATGSQTMTSTALVASDYASQTVAVAPGSVTLA